MYATLLDLWAKFYSHGSVNTAYLLLILLVALPTGGFLASGWRSKRDGIVSSFDESSTWLYLRLFQPQEAKKFKKEEWENSLKCIYQMQNGLPSYIVPWLLLLACNAVFLWMCRHSVLEWIASQKLEGGPYPPEVVAAIAGGYMYGAFDVILRTASRDLLPRHLYEAAFRLLIAVPMAYSLSRFAQTSLAVPLSFALGAFPTGTLFTIIRRFASDAFKIKGDDEPRSSALMQLPTVSQIAAEHFYDVGVGNVSQLAVEDPVILSIRTGLPFIYVTDCTCQALMQKYFGDASQHAYAFGLLGACECRNLIDQLNADQTRQKASETVLKLSTAMGKPWEAVENLLSEVAEDPLTEFYMGWWSGKVQ